MVNENITFLGRLSSKEFLGTIKMCLASRKTHYKNLENVHRESFWPDKFRVLLVANPLFIKPIGELCEIALK